LVAMDTHLTTAGDVIDALGGTGATASLLGIRWPQVVANWRVRGRLPPDRYLVMLAELRARGKTAPPSLWGIASPVEAA
jgi:hypothetical protein